MLQGVAVVVGVIGDAGQADNSLVTVSDDMLAHQDLGVGCSPASCAVSRGQDVTVADQGSSTEWCPAAWIDQTNLPRILIGFSHLSSDNSISCFVGHSTLTLTTR